MRLVVLRAARQDLRRLAAEVASRVATAIDGLAEDPLPPGCRLLRDRDSRTWRVRVGDWRVLYEIDDAAGTVTILRVLHRSKAY
jgi:mRNA interferase RelE/StbE